MPSTVISAFRYDPATATMRIIFVSGNVYEYKNVPEKIYKEMKASGSKGSYFNKHIKDRYAFEKLENYG
jgi:hypothetical protein